MKHQSQPTVTDFGRTPEGHTAQLFTLRNANGLEARITNYGGIITHLMVSDRNGTPADVVLGFDTLEPYFKNTPYLGALIGRVGNRISGGAFTLDGETYELVKNNDPHGVPCHIHGGTKGFNQKLWEADLGVDDGLPILRLRYLSPDGEEGYPGNLECFVTYTLTDDALSIDYLATGDKRTPVSLTNHSYFNLRGEGNGNILGHFATIHAKHFHPVRPGMTPTGETRPVADTPFDFSAGKPIGRDIEKSDEQILLAGGFDLNYVLAASGSDGPILAAMVRDPESGRKMETWTTEPGIQFYTGNSLDGTLTGKCGRPYKKWDGFCLETQRFPDSLNRPEFPSIILEPGKTYQTTTIYRFGVE
ncbi:MAG: galactose-1-epimerase [Verrucomicrobia bacterium]|nr:MAG: galactose-1-epimerase [Verrucomicrobiota bacterium]